MAERALLERHLRLPRVLLAGCGTGREIPFLLELGAHLTALDWEPAMIGCVRRRFRRRGVRLVTGDVCELPALFGEAAFDSIVALGLVSGGLFLDPRSRHRALVAIKGSLAEGGVALLDFLLSPGRRGKVKRFSLSLGGGRKADGCCYWPSRGEVARALSRAGFEASFWPLSFCAEEPRIAAICWPRRARSRWVRIRRAVPG